MDSFVYCWTDVKTNKLYVGWHKGDITDNYICSSKVMLEQYKQRPEDFSREILARGCSEDMVKFETSILKAVNADKDPLFYNMHCNNDKFTHNQPHTEEGKLNLKRGHLNRTKYAKGWKFTEEQKSRHKKAINEYWNSLTEEQRTNEAAKRETVKKKVSLQINNKKTDTCPICNKVGQYNAMKRWHFNNCKVR
jgi:hypothetical protein